MNNDVPCFLVQWRQVLFCGAFRGSSASLTASLPALITRMFFLAAFVVCGTGQDGPSRIWPARSRYPPILQIRRTARSSSTHAILCHRFRKSRRLWRQAPLVQDLPVNYEREHQRT